MQMMPWDIARKHREEQAARGGQSPSMVAFGDPKPVPQPAPQTGAQATQDRNQAAASALDPAMKAAQLEAIRLENEKRRREAAASGEGGVTPRGDTTKVGAEYLATIPDAADRAMVQAMMEGRMGLPSGYAMRSPKALQLMSEAHQADPTLDAVNLPARIAARKNATSGQLGRKINSFNTALGHMQSLAQSVEELDNFGGNTPLTSIANYARNTALSNRPELTRFETSRKAVADELAKAFADAGGAVSDREHWLSLFGENKNPKALRAAVAEAAALLGSKIQASEDQYNGGMGTTGQSLPMLNPHAKDALSLFQGGDYQDRGYGAIAPRPGGGPAGGQGGPGSPPPPLPAPKDPRAFFDEQDKYQKQFEGVAPDARARFNQFFGTLRKGQLNDGQLANVLAGHYQHETGRPLVNAAEIAKFFNQTGKFSTDTEYQKTGKLAEEASADQRKQAFIDAQNITDVRGGKALEGLDAGLRGAANTATWGLADKAVAALSPGDYKSNLARQEKIGQYDAQNHFIPQLSGSALGLMGNEAAVTRGAAEIGRASPMAARLAGHIPQGARPALNDAAYGGIYGAVNTDGTVGDRAEGAALGALATAGGGVAGRAVGRGVGRTLTGSRDAATQALARAGVPMSIGQIAGRGGIVGKSVKAAEDAFESMPILGAAIKARRQEGIEAYNRGTFDQALDPIKETTQGQIGEQGVESARGAIGAAYTKALKNVNVTVQDPVFARNLGRAIGNGQRLHPEVAKDFESIVKDQIAPVLAKGNITGDEYQALQQVLRQERSSWAGQPRGRQYGNVLSQVEKSLESLVRRQAPQAIPALNAANRAYRLSKVAEDAVGRAANTGGVFTPAQLGMAARQSGKKFGNSAATTERPFFDYQRAGQEVLPSKMPNSGTFDRAAFGALAPAALGGVGYYEGMTPEHTAAMMALGIPFTKSGQAAFQKLLLERPDVVRNAGNNLIRSPEARRLFGSAGVYGSAPAIRGLLSD